jgi:Na+/phosphate symporter
MSENQCFRIVRGTDYDQAVKKHFTQRPQWKDVIHKVAVLLGEDDVKEMALLTDELWINLDQITKEENKKLFTKNGKLKSNTKRAKETLESYKQIVSDEGLSDFQELRIINFMYGAMRTQGQHLESFATSENDIYYKADFDLEKKTRGLVEPITEIEYEEKYLEELKKGQ